MSRSGVTDAGIRDVLGPAYGAKTEPVDHAAIASCAIAERAQNNPDIRKLYTRKAQVFTWENFLSPEDCARTIALTEQHLRPSTVTDTRGDTAVRTSSTCDLGEIIDPFVYELDIRISEALGIHWSYSEPNQGQKYLVGQEFKSHTDYFEPNTPEFLPNTGERGQRTWTFMVYLNTTPEGGATRFPRLGKLFRPKEGMAVIWNNLNPDGSVNPHTLHHGMKPRQGEKYIITKWFREKGWGPMFPEANL
jgi:prolyl 4-hydroxylase